MPQPESKRFTLALVRALDQLGPVRTLELMGETFLNAVGGPQEAAYNAAIPHITEAMTPFLDLMKKSS
jgi:hypothetical protein